MDRNQRRMGFVWILVVSIFALGICGQFFFYGRLIFDGLAPWVERHLPEPLADILLLFGHALIAAAVNFWILFRHYRSRGAALPPQAVGILAGLTGLSVYLGMFFAINTFGE